MRADKGRKMQVLGVVPFHKSDEDIPHILTVIPSYAGPDCLPFAHFLGFAEQCGRDYDKYRMWWVVAGPKIKTQLVRNGSCTLAMETGATHVLFIDDDMCVPADLVTKLLAHNKDIITPLFFRGGGDCAPLVFAPGENGDSEPMWDHPPRQLFVAPCGAGTGVMLIKREVLEAVEPPWFIWPNDPERGMDLGFCARAREKGFAVWCDSSIIVPQMSLPQPVGEQQFLESLLRRKEEEVNAKAVAANA
jgi:hypothetical protein